VTYHNQSDRGDDEPLFVISIAAKMVGMHAQSLRNYERLGPVRRAELQSYHDRVLPAMVEEDLFGTAVILAARIAAKAEGGEIVASDVVRQLVAGKGFLFSDRGEVELRGFEEAMRLYEVPWGEGQRFPLSG